MLTRQSIAAAKPDPARQTFLRDTQVPGFGVRITPTGAKSYVLEYRAAGRSRRATFGRVGEMTLTAARERARREMAAIRAGDDDPLERRREAREAPRVNDGLDRFFREFCPERIANGRLTQRTADEYRRQADKVIRPAIGRRMVRDVGRRDVERMVSRLTPAMRNRTLALASRLFNLFETWELRPQHTNPARGVEKAREEPRDRTLAPSEILALGDALDGLEHDHPAAVPAIRMAALTGLRISEVLSARWEHLSVEAGVLTIPRTKTGRRTQPLSSPAVALLDALPRVNDWCFTNGRTPMTYKHVRDVFAKAVGLAGLEDVRLHDLRRTVMTSAAAAGIGVHVLRDLLGHKTTAMADRYIRRTGGALVDATEQTGAAMAAMLSGDKRGEVVPLRRG